MNKQDKELAIKRANDVLDALYQENTEAYNALRHIVKGNSICRSCNWFYSPGFKCACGRDNTYTDEQWAAIQSKKNN